MANKPASGNAGIASRSAMEHLWPGVPEPGRYMRFRPFLGLLCPWKVCRSESMPRKMCACVAGGILLFHAGLHAEIVSVQMEQGSGSAAVGNVTVVVGLSARNSPAFLYQPSAFGVSGHELTVVLYPSWGPLAAFDYMVERVDVGTLKGATYRYAVVAVPEKSGFDEPIIVTGAFTVAPILEITLEPGPPGMQGLRFRWEALDEFSLQWRFTFDGEEEWKPVDSEVIQIGDVHFVFLAPSGDQRLFRLMDVNQINAYLDRAREIIGDRSSHEIEYAGNSRIRPVVEFGERRRSRLWILRLKK